MVKVTLQSNKALASQAPSTWSVTRQIVKENGLGLQGINKGLTATIMRHGVANMVAFGFYFSVQGYTRQYDVSILYLILFVTCDCKNKLLHSKVDLLTVVTELIFTRFNLA